MTTMVKVEALCGPDKQVEIRVTDKNNETEIIILQDSEERFCYVYDDRVVSVKEIEKVGRQLAA